MQTVITDVRNGKYSEDGSVTAEVRFDNETASDGTPLYLPYTAAAHDPAPYGRQLYADLKAGKYGPVTPFTVTPEMVTAAKAAKRAEINHWRDEQENGSYLFEYDGHKWDYGKSTQDRMSISLAMAKRGALPAGFAWTDGENNIVPMDNAGLIALAAAIEQAMFEKGVQINQRQLQMKAEMEALTTLVDIRNYRVGWL
ncbi:DUF4376 domain-containing protein [Salmonella enterica subsp. diarizonae]|nr:DUF4376 domain-containing protein [Salmonella enterica]EBY8711582.1 DUF4376 domain-containing protein [Salmonella enterica subsp. enterica serovar Kottbus]EDU8162644.1 DUF4376 domain-containing protein [Salmonella enterica subsp. diarizonae]QXC19209.1 DUF4376 domain-containing protein [Citrobacter braakii]HBJ7176175.1 DUF4376 domain-containing protein [Salmonella enterica subsp. enterica serovar Chincol]